MTAKGLFICVLVALIGLGASLADKEQSKQEPRLFFTGLTGGTDDGGDQTLSLGSNGLVTLGLIIAALIAGVIIFGVLLSVGSSIFKSFDNNDYGYSAPSYYNQGYNYGSGNSRESSYAVHRTLEDAARKFEE